MHYLWKMKPVRFNGLPVFSSNNPDLLEFKDKDTFDIWYRGLVAGLAELDEAMNYCAFFVREKGNVGNYVRDGKSFPVDGSWVGIQDFDNYAPCQPFVSWLNDNGWREKWFELMPRYWEHQKLSYDIRGILQ